MLANFGINMTAGLTNLSERTVSKMKRAARSWQLKQLKMVKKNPPFFFLDSLNFFVCDILAHI